MNVFENEDILEHFGIKGMQWGVRKKKPLSERRATRRTTGLQKLGVGVAAYGSYAIAMRYVANMMIRRGKDPIKSLFVGAAAGGVVGVAGGKFAQSWVHRHGKEPVRKLHAKALDTRVNDILKNK